MFYATSRIIDASGFQAERTLDKFRLKISFLLIWRKNCQLSNTERLSQSYHSKSKVQDSILNLRDSAIYIALAVIIDTEQTVRICCVPIDLGGLFTLFSPPGYPRAVLPLPSLCTITSLCVWPNPTYQNRTFRSVSMISATGRPLLFSAFA